MIFSSFKKIFRNPSFIMLNVIVALAVFMFIVLFPNQGLLKNIFLNHSISLYSKFTIPTLLLGSIFTSFSIFSALYVIIISLLFGLYVATMTYFIQHRIKEIGDSGIPLGFLGMLSGILGLGCAACGMFLFTNLSLVSLSWSLAFLPLGIIFQILGGLLLLIAIYLTLKKIANPLICPV